MVLTDSSSYGLSSAVLGALVRVANRISTEQARSSVDTVTKIREELLATLKEKDKLSLFYGVLSRKDYRLRYLNLGTSCAFYAPNGRGFEPLRSQGQPITRASGEIGVKEIELALEPGSRLVLVSDGFVDALEGPGRVKELLDTLRGKEPSDSLNELTFKLKASYRGEDEMPPQDCTGVVLDLDTRLIRLAG
jgi:serine phosphatase RsbU (regulator of sigma subunit)